MENKKYPGYAPDPQSGTNSDAFTEAETNADSDLQPKLACCHPCNIYLPMFTVQ